MLKPKVISQALRQTLNDVVKAAMIMTSEGSLIAFAADTDKEATIYAAISANIWNTYRKKNVYTELKYQILHCEEGVIYITNVGPMILCLVGNSKAINDLGILKAKGEAIKSHLEEPLLQFAALG
ncbi:hypothetical protein CU097_006089 [Rhizopus azygosporus]|uniref:Roadblock/LAMTOR2 domain-containing protein n=2 Tax=Rhizopus TaxID=4842 RepID=A0A367JT75_RHIAZ|nr:Roadblock/LC7 domain-containing protein [Rhizopus microsporus]RCH92891.1 hypothetical protein CU097_006089 [Rhizopus azygosporus]CEG66811.1 hypothetical protein RMATCC62417_03330 [Rhizopus microsporus]